MPYFKSPLDSNKNILFIHIPKTGGSSVESYFCKKNNISFEEAFVTDQNKVCSNGVVYQHQVYTAYKQNKEFVNIDFNNLEIITIVRNPYHRIISDLFYFKLINSDTTPEDVFIIIQNLFTGYKENEYIYH